MPEQATTRRKPPSPYRIVLFAALAYAFILAFPLVSPILLSLLLILILSLAFNPLVHKCHRWVGGRTVATVLLITGVMAVAALTAWGFYTPVRQAAVTFVEQLPEYWERIQRPLMKLERRAAVTQERLQEEVTDEVIREHIEREGVVPPHPSTKNNGGNRDGMLRSGLTQLLGGLASGFQSIAGNLATLFVIVVTVFFGVIFTLSSPHQVIAAAFAVIPERHHDIAMRVARRIAFIIPRWALAMLLGMLAVGFLVFLFMWPILGFEEAVMLGLIAMVLEALPYIGPFLAVLPAFLLALGEGGWTPLLVLASYAIIQMAESHLISPVIVGGRLHLHPLAVVFSLLVCVMVFGVLAVLIAIPMVTIVRILHEELYRPRFLPGVSGDDLIALSRQALRETPEADQTDKER